MPILLKVVAHTQSFLWNSKRVNSNNFLQVSSVFCNVLYDHVFLNLCPPVSSTPSYVLCLYQRVKANDDFLSALAEHQDKLVVIKFYDRFCRACDEIRHRFEDLSGSAGVDQAAFYEIEVS